MSTKVAVFCKKGSMQEGNVSTLGSWLGERCKSEGLSLRQAAVKTGLSHSTLAGIVKGNIKVCGETIKKLAKYFGGDGRRRWVLEDQLLVLAGYRTERPEEDELSEPMAHLMDTVSQFSKQQLKIMTRFANFLNENT